MTGKRLGFLAMAAGVIVLVSQWAAVSDVTEALIRQEHVRKKKVVYWTSSGLQDILFASFLSGTPPDVLDVSVADVREMVVTGKIRPLDALLEDELKRDPGFLKRSLLGEAQVYRFRVNPDDRFIRRMDEYPREAARLLKMNGKVLGFRAVDMPSALTYNKRLFREAAKMFPDAASVMIGPVIVLFLMVQKHVVKAIPVGAVKG